MHEFLLRIAHKNRTSSNKQLIEAGIRSRTKELGIRDNIKIDETAVYVS